MTSSNDPKKPAGDDVKQMLTDLSVKLIKAEAKRLIDETPAVPKLSASRDQDEKIRRSKAKQLLIVFFVVSALAAWATVLWNEPATPAPVRATHATVSQATCTKSVTSEVKDSTGHVVSTQTETQTGPCQAGTNDSAINAAVNVGAHMAKWAILSLF